MSAIPKGVLCPTCRKVIDTVKKVNTTVKRNIMLYAFASILIVEVLSATYLRDTISDGCQPFWYIFLTQLVLFVVFLNWNYNRKLLRFCNRQILIVRSLIAYYFIGVISLIFKISDNTYIDVVKWLLIVFASIILLKTIVIQIRRNKK